MNQKNLCINEGETQAIVPVNTDTSQLEQLGEAIGRRWKVLTRRVGGTGALAAAVAVILLHMHPYTYIVLGVTGTGMILRDPATKLINKLRHSENSDENYVSPILKPVKIPKSDLLKPMPEFGERVDPATKEKMRMSFNEQKTFQRELAKGLSGEKIDHPGMDSLVYMQKINPNLEKLAQDLESYSGLIKLEDIRDCLLKMDLSKLNPMAARDLKSSAEILLSRVNLDERKRTNTELKLLHWIIGPKQETFPEPNEISSEPDVEFSLQDFRKKQDSANYAKGKLRNFCFSISISTGISSERIEKYLISQAGGKNSDLTSNEIEVLKIVGESFLSF